jgi:hypothetical protein
MTTVPLTAALMTEPHRLAGCGAAFDWCLPAGAAETLAAGARGCFVRVEDGALWLTRTLGRSALERGEQPDDLWLAAGESQWLPAGSHWVLQPWPAARVRLLQAPPAPRRVALRRGLGAVLAPLLAAVPASLRRRLGAVAPSASLLPSTPR